MRPTRTVAARICCSASVRRAPNAVAAASDGVAALALRRAVVAGAAPPPRSRGRHGGRGRRWLVFACGLPPRRAAPYLQVIPLPLIAPSNPSLLLHGGLWSPDLVCLGCGSGGSPGEILGRSITTVTTSTGAVPLPGGSVEVLPPSPLSPRVKTSSFWMGRQRRSSPSPSWRCRSGGSRAVRALWFGDWGIDGRVVRFVASVLCFGG